jgi:hypothetical protein
MMLLGRWVPIVLCVPIIVAGARVPVGEIPVATPIRGRASGIGGGQSSTIRVVGTPLAMITQP